MYWIYLWDVPIEHNVFFVNIVKVFGFLDEEGFP